MAKFHINSKGVLSFIWIYGQNNWGIIVMILRIENINKGGR